jgi:CHAT domain-containing protein/Tfp pilus assembly protein PilF
LSRPELTKGSDLRRSLAVGETHPFRIRLERGTYLRVDVAQRGTDVSVGLRSPSGHLILVIDSPNGTRGPEELSAVAPVSGEYGIEIRGLESPAKGAYELKVEELRPASGEDQRRAAAVRAFSVAEQLRSRGRAEALHRAIDRYREALRHWQHLKEAGWQAMTLRRLGQTWSIAGEIRQAHRAFQEALSLQPKLGDHAEETRLLNELGPTYRLLGEPEKAADCYQRSLRLARETRNRPAEVTALNNLGVVYASIGETQKALAFYDRALAGWRELKDPVREADTLLNVGEIYTSLGSFDEAIDLLRQALTLKRQAGDRRGQAAALSTLGRAWYLAGDLRAALDAFDRSLQLRRETGDRRGEAATLDRRATVLAQLGRMGEARAGYRAALAVFQQTGELASEAQVLTSMGWLDESIGQADLALERFDRSLRLFRQIGDRNSEAFDLMGSARAELRLGRLSQAQVAIEKALRIIESIHSSEVQSRTFKASYLASRQEYYELHVQILMARDALEPGRGWQARALEASNRARARSLLESLAEAQADHLAETEPTLLAKARSLATRIQSREIRRTELLGRGSSAGEVATLERELSILNLEDEVLQGRIRRATPRIAALSRAPSLTLRDIQQLLDRNTLLLWYALGTERSFLWVVGSHSLTTSRLPGRKEVERAAQQVHELLAKSNKKEVREQAQLAALALSEMVVAPAADQLGKKRLLIASDGALQYVPFAALPMGRRRAPLLAEHEVVCIPSAAVLALVRRGLAEHRPAPKALAVLADPVFSRDDPRVLQSARQGVRTAGPASDVERSGRESGLDRFDRLLYSATEAEAILALVPPSERFEALGFEANRALVLKGRLSQYRILHFATHSLLNARHPELSGVVLSLVDPDGRPQDGFLRVHDLLHLSFPADLVVLSACRTALGKEVRGEGLVGLTHGFLVAGAGRVLVSLWNVNDLATAELMERFYRHLLRGGMRPAEALRAAQLSMLREERWAAPYYWAGFTLQGEWR